MANTPEAVISFYAVSKIGAIVNMIHPLSAEEEIKESLNATNTVILITMNINYNDDINSIANCQLESIDDNDYYKDFKCVIPNYFDDILIRR